MDRLQLQLQNVVLKFQKDKRLQLLLFLVVAFFIFRRFKPNVMNSEIKLVCRREPN